MILITGANGQLGKDFQKLFDQLQVPYVPAHHTAIDGYRALDVTDDNAVQAFIRDHDFKMIINCAAYNNVDQAELERERAIELNCHAPRRLAEAAKASGAAFVTYSTDFVFDGEKKQPYVETDQANPLSVYAESKFRGEQAVLETYERSFVIRTSWVFGLGNHNFNKSVINWSQSKNELSIVDDQVSVPTYTKDLAVFTWDLVQTNVFGLYHLTNQGEASKYDQAKYVLDKLRWKGTLHRGKTSDFPLPAKRAPYSKLDSAKAEHLVGRQMPHWKDAIDRFIDEMKEAGELE